MLPGVVVESSGHVVDTQGRIFVVQVQFQLVPGVPVGADLLIDLTTTNIKPDTESLDSTELRASFSLF